MVREWRVPVTVPEQWWEQSRIDLDAAHVMPAVRKALDVLAGRVRVVGAYLFGSHVEGTPGPYSDVDLAVFAEGAEHWGLFERVDLATYVQSRVSHRIDPHFFPAHALEHPEPGSFAEFVIEHGRRIDLNASG